MEINPLEELKVMLAFWLFTTIIYILIMCTVQQELITAVAISIVYFSGNGIFCIYYMNHKTK